MLLDERKQEVSANRASLGNGHPATLESLFQLADAFRIEKQLDEAYATLRELLMLRAEHTPDNEVELQRALLLMSLVQYEKRDLETARSLQEEALRVFSDLQGPNSTNAVISARHLEETLQMLGEEEDLRKIQERILASQLENLTENHPDTVVAMRRLAATYRNFGDAMSAAGLERRSIEVAERIDGDMRQTLMARQNLMIDLKELGEFIELGALADRIASDANLLAKNDPLRKQIQKNRRLLRFLINQAAKGA